MMGLDGKIALVTGGGAGIGRGIAEAFAKAGCKLVIAEKDALRARDASAALGDGHLIVEADVTREQEVERLFAAVADRFDRVDVLVNNVGDFLRPKMAFEDTGTAHWDELYAVNLLHVFLVTRAAIPLMRKSGQGGSIISLSTIEAFRAIPGMAVYSAFKAALTGFTRSLALELAPDGIRVNQIAPETTESEQVRPREWVTDALRPNVGRWFPLGRFGTPADCAGAALYLAGDLSTWVTGTTLHVDGGALAAGGYYRAPDGRWTHYPILADGPHP